MAKRNTEKGLGRGLGALFGEGAMLESEAVTTTLPVSQIEASLKQPRKNFEGESLDDLADSIRMHGVLQPIIVRQLASGYYQIISGERRWRACRQAGVSEIPAMVIEADDRKSLEIGLIENLQREDLNPMEEANGYQGLMTEHGMTQEQVAERVGKSRPAVANALRLLSLPQEVRDMVAEGDLSGGHARTLIPLGDAKLQIQLAQRILADGLSVRQTEELVKRLQKPKREQEKKENPNQIYYTQAETDLGSRLGRKVHITPGKRKGRLELEYYGVDDLNDLLDALQTVKLTRKEDTP
ncbi:MAG: ParB/RepB/Spo0J family partition protein [Oscillospiraceae bacterium]|nr:ParB/RepB/Spo0J family partition protein [Oscillospiraceae bacterium]